MIWSWMSGLRRGTVGHGQVGGTRYTSRASQHTLAAFSKNLEYLDPSDRLPPSEFLPLEHGFCLLEATVFSHCECLGLVVRGSKCP